jgi:hypothetical protein
VKIIDEATLDLFRVPVPCEWCKLRPSTDPHHIYAKGMGGGGRLDIRINICSLCRTCHNGAHAHGDPHITELLRIVSRREKLPVGTILDRIYELRRLPKGAALPDWMAT